LADPSRYRSSGSRPARQGRLRRAGNAFLSLVSLLAARDDADGLRAAHVAAPPENPDSLYALTQLGQVLEHQGNIAGAHEAWQQAIDAGQARGHVQKAAVGKAIAGPKLELPARPTMNPRG
jgi:hypothetical protein